MAFFSYAHPILLGQEEALRDFYLKKEKRTKNNENELQAQKDLAKLLGIRSFRAWIQTTEACSYFVRIFEGDSLSAILQRYQYFLASEVPFFLALDNLYKNTIGIDFSAKADFPHLKLLASSGKDSSPQSSFIKALALEVKEGKEVEVASFLEAACSKGSSSLHKLRCFLQEELSTPLLILEGTFSSPQASFSDFPFTEKELKEFFSLSSYPNLSPITPSCLCSLSKNEESILQEAAAS